jgi:glycosyltransferase involved in cell wall biosynthesis
MACGTPVVCSNRASLPEVMGEVGPCFDPQDINGMADQLHKLLSDTSVYQSQVEKGLEHTKSFNWQDAVSQIKALYMKYTADYIQ